MKRNNYNTHSIIIFSIQTLIFYFIFMRDRRRERGKREREKREERDSKFLKEKQSQEISCFHERFFHAKIEMLGWNMTKS